MPELDKKTTTVLSYSLWGWPSPSALMDIIKLFPEDAALKIEVDNGAMTPRVVFSATIVVT